MQDKLNIRKIAVLGSGVMGAQIAAHCVNAGFKTCVFDLKKGMAEKAIANLEKLKPVPLGSNTAALYLEAKNYEDDIDDLKNCDLIIEAISERMDWKEDLFNRIAPFLHKKAILVSNTSGLSIDALSKVLPENLQARFCGVHFFNPPRYMHLAELIPSKKTAPELLNQLETWLTSYLGKGVVRAKDTPNFIANRVGVFSLLVTLHHAKTFDISLDEIDALTGTLIGRPKSATCRTMDVVGLDTMQHVVETMQSQLKKDPWHDLYQLPGWFNQMIKDGHLGQKTGQGIYRKQGKQIEVWDIKSGQYVPAVAAVSDEVKTLMKNKDPQKLLHNLFNSTHPQAQFLASCFRDLFLYSAWHLKDIAHTVRDVDEAMRWGFGWQFGPFETWQQAGLSEMMPHFKHSLFEIKPPEWLNAVNAFYTSEGAYSPVDNNYSGKTHLPVYAKQLSISNDAEVIYENTAISLRRFKDDAAVLSFKTKANTISQEVLDGLEEALKQAEKSCTGLIIYQNDAANFSSGADLRGINTLIQDGKFKALEAMVAQFQTVLMQIKYASFPVVAAVRGLALGGGCELLMHCSAVVAAFESYPGLVEAGVGLLPAGGGSKEMALRAACKAGDGDLLSVLQPCFQQVATAAVSQSAADARTRLFYRSTDSWVMHKEEVLYAALAKINALNAANYKAPLPARFKVAGREGHATLHAGLVNWLEGGFITRHDFEMADKMAYVLCGGEVYQGEWVDETWMLKLERDCFIALAENPLTQARITSMLENGKPLRN